MKGVFSKKTIAKKLVTTTFMFILIICLILANISVASAANTPSFGSAPTSITLFVNDSNNDYRTINIPVKNWKKGYTYHAFSNDTYVAKVDKASVNSKTGVTFNVTAKKIGITQVTVQMKNASKKVVQSKTIKVQVLGRNLAVPSSLRMTSSTKSSIKISYSLNNKDYVNGYWFEVSTSSSFAAKNTKSYKVLSSTQMSATFDSLKRGTRYYIRMASMSNRNGCILRSKWSSVLRSITKS